MAKTKKAGVMISSPSGSPSEIGHFLCSVISQGKVVALDKFSGAKFHPDILKGSPHAGDLKREL